MAQFDLSKAFTLEQFIADYPHKIYYSDNSVWWTHDSSEVWTSRDLSVGNRQRDPFGNDIRTGLSSLWIADRTTRLFVSNGVNTMRNLMLAHHRNLGRVSIFLNDLNVSISDVYRDWESFFKYINALIPSEDI